MTDLNTWARVGAQARLADIQSEVQSILKAFPDLGGTGARHGRPAGNDAAPTAKRRARYNMSAAQKKAVSVRMRKYWAARRKAKA